MTTTYPIPEIRDNVNMVVVNTVLLATASIAVVLRIWSRRLIKVGLGLDDYLITFSLFALYIIYIIDMLFIAYGQRRHLTEVGMDHLQVLLKILIPYQFTYGTTMVAIKLSYLTFFRRIFRVRESFTKYANTLMVLVGLWWIANNLQIFLMCRPFAMNWNPLLPGTCGNRPLSFSLVATFNIITDVGILLLPIPYIKSLQMQTKKKFVLILMFSLGLFITAISAVRLNAMARLDFSDLPWAMYDSALWTVVEPAVAITNACLPMLRPSIQKIAPSLLPTTNQEPSEHGLTQTIGGSRSRGTAHRIYDEEDEIRLTRVEKDGSSTMTLPCSASNISQ